MASERKIRAARANGARSRGPITPEGKARSAMNALKHGLRSRRIAPIDESDPAFQALLESYTASFTPRGPVERGLVHRMAAARWHLGRIVNLETGILAREMDRQPAASPFASCAYALLGRAESRFRRGFARAFDALEQRQKKRTNEPTAAALLEPRP